MVDYALEYRAVFDKLCKEERITSARRLSQADWAYLKTLVDFLSPFKEATLAVSGEKYPSLSLVLPVYQDLTDHIETTLEGLPLRSELRGSIQDSKDKLLKYFSIISKYAFYATFLDTRFKDSIFGRNSNYSLLLNYSLDAHTVLMYDRERTTAQDGFCFEELKAASWHLAPQAARRNALPPPSMQQRTSSTAARPTFSFSRS